MHILSLSVSTRFYAVRRLVEEAKRAGIACHAAEYRDLRLFTDDGHVRIDTGQGTFDARDYSHVMFRLSGEFAALHNACAHAVLRGQGFVMNAAWMRDNIGLYTKLLQLLRLSDAGLPVIPTRIAGNEKAHQAFVQSTISARGDALLKPMAGGRGNGIAVIDSMAEHADLNPDPKRMLVQDYLPVSSDLRVLVLGGQALGAIERLHPQGSHISNVSQGAEARAIPLEAAIENLAVQATQVMGADFAGVDILIHGGHPYILEVNVMPQFEGFEGATGQNIAAEVISWLRTQA